MSQMAQSIQDALTAHQAGDLAGAEQRYRAILDDDPSQHEVWNMLGQVYAQRFLFDQAAQHIGKAIALKPDQGGYYFFLANALRKLGKLDEAAGALRTAVELRGQHFEIHLQLCTLLEELGRTDELAEARAGLTAALPPTAAQAELLADQRRAMPSRTTEAITLYEHAVSLDPASTGLLVKLADCLFESDRFDDAIARYQQALELNPRTPGAAAGLVRVCERLSRLDDARWYAGSALELDPGDPMLNLALARLDRRDKNLPAARGRLEQQLHNPRITSKWTYGSMLVELGHTLDALGLYDEAFARFAQGQSTLAERTQAAQYPLAEYPAWLGSVAKKFSPAMVESWDDPAEVLAETPAPIFFVGFPRSGTTLLESMLAAHPRLVGTDEAGLLPELMNKVKALVGDTVLFPDNLALLTPEHIATLRAQYHADARALLGHDRTQGKRIVDKLPLNIARLPAMRRIFPDAKILVAIRDPRDCCLSAFFQIFGPNHAMVHFHSLETSCRLYAQVMGLYMLYKQMPGLDLMETRYEDLVQDTQNQARAVVEFLGEDWSDEVLAWRDHDTDKAVSTASYQQVTEPIYQRSRARWKHYEQYLAPHAPMLAPFIERFGYSSAD